MKWEYKVESTEVTIQQLNELGLQGWELIAVKQSGRTSQFIFKRQVK